MLSSFVYEDLVSHVQIIRNQMFEIENILSNRKQDELKSRSLIFIDPYGNRTINKYMDHESINKITAKYIKDYVPKYLQQWIKIGTINKSYKLGSTVANYMNGYQFITYGLVTIRISTEKNIYLREFVLPVLLMDNIEKIKLQIKARLQNADFELTLWKINQNTDDKEMIMLKSDDTIMSCQLYQNNCVIMATVISKTVIRMNSNDLFQIFVRNGFGKSITFNVYSSMKIFILKALIQINDGVPLDQQCLIFGSKVLEDERTLSDYKIEKESTIHMQIRARGGMYHFTSGRQDFNKLPYDGVKAIQDVLAFKTKNINQISLLPSDELQNFLLQAQDILSNLYNAIQGVLISSRLPSLTAAILSIATDDDGHQSNIDS